MNLNHVIDTDVLVIGGGAAGIRAAIEASRQIEEGKKAGHGKQHAR
jgi:succinate dehydrogenase/fumarate reductase flavoprotein subunit